MNDVTRTIQEWKDQLSDTVSEFEKQEIVEAGTGLALTGAGAISAAAVVVSRDRRRSYLWVLPVSLLTAGLGFVLAAAWQYRARRIAQVEDTLRQELEGLDRVARAQVIKDVVQDEAEELLARDSA
ncbi:MAG: hypothetical protein PF636_07090 [Actinomycetota bacterium]|jgi:hypothetical protein|nr:hypothetical protein [Actinomycetota bacterium]